MVRQAARRVADFEQPVRSVAFAVARVGCVCHAMRLGENCPEKRTQHGTGLTGMGTHRNDHKPERALFGMGTFRNGHDPGDSGASCRTFPKDNQGGPRVSHAVLLTIHPCAQLDQGWLTCVAEGVGASVRVDVSRWSQVAVMVE